MSLDKKDLELIEHLLYKSTDDLAVSVARSFERLEERVDASEARLNTRFGDVEDRIEGTRQDVVDEIGDIQADIRETIRVHDKVEFY